MIDFKRFLDTLTSRLGSFFGVGVELESARMSPRRAIEYAPVWYAVNKVAGHFSQLPINCHRRSGRNIEIDMRHPGHRLVHSRPNDYQTPPEWKMQGAYQLLLNGNWRCAIEREGSRPVSLLPFNGPSSSMWVDGVRWHGTTVCRHEPLGVAIGLDQDSAVIWIRDDNVLFVHGLSVNGIDGVDPSSVMADSLDAGMAAGEQVRRQARHGFSGSLMLEAPAGMFRNEEEAKAFLKMFREAHDGSENAGKTALLREGIKANVVTMTGRDSQWIEQRLFQRQEAAMWFLLEEIIGDDSSVSYNSLAEKHLAYLTNCLNRWLVHVEAACDRSLLTERQKDSGSHYFKFNTNALMRMDPPKQAEYLTKLIASRVLSPNEAREKLDMNPYEGGDTYDNPAITTNREPEPAEETEESATDAPNDAARRSAIVSRLRHLIGIEQQRVGQAAKNKHPLASFDRFYGKWQESLGKVCEELGGSAEHAADHCRESQDQLLTLMQSTEKDSLPDAVGELSAAWSERAETLADRILNDV